MAFANEPSGTLLTEWDFSSQSFPDRWGYDWAPPIYSNGGSGSYSAPYYARQAYPIGFVGGVSPNNFYYFLPSGGVWSLYASWFWRVSNPWQGHSSGGNKINFFWADGFSIVYEMNGPVAGPWDYAIYYPNQTAYNDHLPSSYGDSPGTRHLLPNINNDKITLGVWHELELLVTVSTSITSQDGVLRWWADGVLKGSHSNVNYPRAPMQEFWFSPTWGGVEDVKTQNDYFDYDHVRLVVPSGEDPPPPPTPPQGTLTLSAR